VRGGGTAGSRWWPLSSRFLGATGGRIIATSRLHGKEHEAVQAAILTKNVLRPLYRKWASSKLLFRSHELFKADFISRNLNDYLDQLCFGRFLHTRFVLFLSSLVVSSSFLGGSYGCWYLLFSIPKHSKTTPSTTYHRQGFFPFSFIMVSSVRSRTNSPV